MKFLTNQIYFSWSFFKSEILNCWFQGYLRNDYREYLSREWNKHGKRNLDFGDSIFGMFAFWVSISPWRNHLREYLCSTVKEGYQYCGGCLALRGIPNFK